MKNKNSKIFFFTNERILLIIILLSTFISYFQITDYEFIKWDDDTQITENSYVKSLDLQSINHNLHQERYTFLTLTTFSAIYNVWGNNPIPFHWFSLIFHLINIVLIFLLTKKLINNIHIVALVTLLFALHPLRVESVAWISEFKDLLFTFFSLISFLLYIKYIQSNKFIYFIFTTLCVLFASFSKIQGLLIPISLFLFDIYYNRKFSILLVIEKVFLFYSIFFIFQLKAYVFLIIVISIYFIFRKKLHEVKFNSKYVIASISIFIIYYLFKVLYNLILNKAGLWAENNNAQNSFSIIQKFLLAGFALWFYLSNFILPHSINAVHPYPIKLVNGNLPQEYYFTLIVLLIVIAISLFIFIKREKIPCLMFFGWFFFLINISMVLHFIPIEGRLVVADRYSYLAYFGLFITFSDIIEKYFLAYIKKYLLVIFSILLITLSISTYNRCMVWKNTKTLFNDVLSKNPNVPFAYLNLAATYLNQQKVDSALFFYSQAIKLDSVEPTVYFNRAFAFDMLGKNDNAINDFNKVLQYDKNNIYEAVVYTYLGESYRKKGNDSLAFYYYNLSLKEDSMLSLAYYNRGTYFLNKNMLKEASADLEKSIKIDKFNAPALNIYGWLLTMQGKYEKALIYFNRSLNSNPNYAFAYNNKGYAEFMLGNLTDAIYDYNKALSLDPNLMQAYLNRGWAFASTKNYQSAVDDFTTVLKFDNNNQLARNNRAYAWYYLKEYKNATDDFKTNISIYPKSALAWQNLAWFHMQIKDFDNAINEFNKSIEYDGSLINSYINIGWIWLEKNNAKNAENYYKKALSINPQNIDALFLIAELYRKQNKNKLACEYYIKSSKLGNNQAKQAIEMYCKK